MTTPKSEVGITVFSGVQARLTMKHDTSECESNT
jgi:hypothetical protein